MSRLIRDLSLRVSYSFEFVLFFSLMKFKINHNILIIKDSYDLWNRDKFCCLGSRKTFPQVQTITRRIQAKQPSGEFVFVNIYDWIKDYVGLSSRSKIWIKMLSRCLINCSSQKLSSVLWDNGLWWFVLCQLYTSMLYGIMGVWLLYWFCHTKVHYHSLFDKI